MAIEPKTLGRALDEIIGALDGLHEATRMVAVRAACEQLRIPIPTATPPPATGAADVPKSPEPRLRSLFRRPQSIFAH